MSGACPMPKIHLDTDLGGDIDDLCALAMLLRWPGVEIAGITTVAEDNGKRAGYVRHALKLEGREDTVVAAGADVASGHYRYELGYPGEQAYWGARIPPSPGPVDEALLLLKNNIEQGAIVISIGPFTNLHLLDRRFPGIVRSAPLFLMGGYINPPREGFPQWGIDMDYNIQVDIPSAEYVINHSEPTLIPVTITVETSLRRACLDRLRTAGALGALIARQAEAFAQESKNEENYGRKCSRVPDDTINFQHDPLACAIALGWNDGVEITEIPLKLEHKDGWLYEQVDPAGKPTRVVTRIDGNKFNQLWLEVVCGRAQTGLTAS